MIFLIKKEMSIIMSTINYNNYTYAHGKTINDINTSTQCEYSKIGINKYNEDVLY